MQYLLGRQLLGVLRVYNKSQACNSFLGQTFLNVLCTHKTITHTLDQLFLLE